MAVILEGDKMLLAIYKRQQQQHKENLPSLENNEESNFVTWNKLATVLNNNTEKKTQKIKIKKSNKRKS